MSYPLVYNEGMNNQDMQIEAGQLVDTENLGWGIIVSIPNNAAVYSPLLGGGLTFSLDDVVITRVYETKQVFGKPLEGFGGGHE